MDTPALAPRMLAGLAHRPWPDTLASVAAIRGMLGHCDDPATLDAIAAALPRRLAPLAPELALALAGLALALADHGPTLPEDIEDVEAIDQIEPALRLAWLRVRVSVGMPDEALDATPDAALATMLQPASDWSLLDVREPLRLLSRAARADDAELRARVPPLLGMLLDALALDAAQALACLRTLVEREPLPAAALLALLRAPGFAALVHDATPQLVALLVRLVAHDAAQACALLRALGQREQLVALALDVEQPALVRERALVELGPLARDEDLVLAFELHADDPLALGAALRQLLLAAHRHGAFVRAPELDALLDAYDRHLAWTGDELVRVAYLVRDALLERLAALPPDDPRWLRRAAILAALPEGAAASCCATLLRHTSTPAIAAALADAGAHLPEFDDEDALLLWFDRIPARLLPALRVKGRSASFERLRALLLDPTTPTPLRGPALTTAWALADARERFQHELCAALGPWDSGLLDPTHAHLGDDRLVTLAVSPPWPERPEYRLAPRDLLQRLCSRGDRRLVPHVIATYRRCVEDVVAAALAGDFTIKRVQLPELEQALYRFGRALLAEGRVVRPYLAAAPETGRDFVLEVVLAWLREDPPQPIVVALLETLGRHDPSGPALQQLLAYWRHRDVDVQRAAIEALIAGSVEPLRGLELSLSRLASSPEPRIARQAIEAIGHFEAAWAEPLLLAALQRPDMAIKKAAAQALALLAGPQSIPTLVHWLARHDNTAFRTSLLAALERAAGSAMVAILVEAHAQAEDVRSRELLADALDRRISLAAAVRLARREAAGTRALVDALLGERMHLRDHASDTLATALGRAKLRPTRVGEDPLAPLRRLRIEGFAPALALALPSELAPAHEAELLVLIGANLPAWLAWLEHDAAAPDRALDRVVRACMHAGTKPGEQLDRVLALLERRGPTAISCTAMLALLDGLIGEGDVRRKARGLALVRARPPEAELRGPLRHRLIARLGGVQTPADLAACLRACQLGPQLAADSTALLFEALAIPVEQPDEVQRFGEARAQRRAELREGARSWHRLAPADADAWLAELLARRPLGVPIPARPPREPKPPFVPRTRADRARLLDSLAEGDAAARERAASLLCAWPDALRESGPALLDAYLAGRIALADRRAQLAAQLVTWPSSPTDRVRARALIDALDDDQLARLVPGWIAGLLDADDDARECLRRLPNARLLPHAREHARHGRLQLVALLQPDDSLALRVLVDELRDTHPDAIAHLLPRAEPLAAAPAGDPASDPAGAIMGRSLAELVALARARETNPDLAVRAIHALAEQGDAAADALEPFTLDRRARIRSAALRAFRKLVTRERGLDAIVQVLAIETRDDVILSLLASLGHAKHAPGLPQLVDYLVHREPKLREGAASALLAWGPAVLPGLRRAAAKARPDHARSIAALIDRIAGHD